MEPKCYEICDLCEQPFRYGAHRYDGRYVPRWKVRICDTCDKMNWDGIVVSGRDAFLEKLRANGVEIKLNERGLLMIPPMGAV